jgi:N-acetylglucosamine malate deacetylase 1
MNILAIGAHPDDVELNCGGTLAKYKKQGHEIFIALTTSGNIGSNSRTREEIAAIRENEQLEAAKVTGAKVRFMRYDDEGLQDTPESRRSVLNAIRWANPDVIFTHYTTDKSTDHAMTSKIVSEVMLSIGAKNVPSDEKPIDKVPSLFYWDTSAGIGFLPEVYVDISDFADIKKEALRKHVSQFEWMSRFMDDELDSFMDILGKFRGMQAGFSYGEAFIGHRIHGFMPNFKLLP